MNFRRLSIINPKQERDLFRKRLATASLASLFLVLLLIGRLFQLQVLQLSHYTTLSRQNILNLSPIVPNRGLIYDRNGVLLADNAPVFNLEIIPGRVKNLKQTLAALNQLIPLNESELQTFYKQIKQHRRFEAIPLRFKLTDQEIANFYQHQHLFPGVRIHAQLIRRYLMGSLYDHVLGYVGRINEAEMETLDPVNYLGSSFIGKSGLEKYYETELHGNIGYEEVEMDAFGREVRTQNALPPTVGTNLYLTIDTRLQQIADQAFGEIRGALVAIDPSNGQVLAMVSRPHYDPNQFVAGINQKDYQMLQNHPYKPLYNRALRGLYAPASTIKPFIALAGLEYETPLSDQVISDPGWYQLPQSSHVYHDWKEHGHGAVTLETAVIQSCDTYFYQLAQQIGIQRIALFLKPFGFGQKTGLDNDGELSGVLPSPAWKLEKQHHSWYPGDTLITGIGQGYFLITPMQLAHTTACLANQGRCYRPYLKYAHQMPGKNIETMTQGISLPEIPLHKEHWKKVAQAMQSVINDPRGTGFIVYGRSTIPVAGKTGTAQVFRLLAEHRKRKIKPADLPEHLRDHSLFIAFAPADNPKIAIACVAEHTAGAAAQITRKVIDEYFKLYPINSTTPEVSHAPT